MAFIIVPQGERRVVSFSEQEGLFTANLEACVAIAGSYNGKGAMVHATQRDDVGAQISWFRDQIPSEGRVYLAGGMEGKAEDFVARIRQLLHGYKLREEVLTPYHLDLWLKQDRVNVHLFTHQRTPEGMQPITMGSYSL